MSAIAISDPVVLENFSKWQYQTESAILVPYLPRAKDAFSDDFLVRQYVQLLHDDLLDTIFPENPPMDLNQFVAYCIKHEVQVLCKKESEVGPFTPIGFGWVYDKSGIDFARIAKVGFVFYKQYWRTKLIRQAAMLLVDWWLNCMEIDVLYGTMLATNRLGLNFAKKFGFQFLTRLPLFFLRNGAREDGLLVCLVKPTATGKANGGQGSELVNN